MRLFRRTPTPTPAPADPHEVARNLRAFADDLIAGEPWALTLVKDGLPLDDHEWTEYIDDRNRCRAWDAEEAATA